MIKTGLSKVNQIIPSGIRHYKSLSVSINDLNCEKMSRTSYMPKKFDNVALHESIKKLLNNQGHNTRIRKRLTILKNKLGPEFALSDELLIKSLYIFHKDHIEIKSENEQKTLVNIQSIEKLGFDLFRLQRHLFIVTHFKETDKFSLNILNQRLTKLLLSNFSLQSYVGNDKLLEATFKSTFEPDNRIKTSYKTLYTIIGLLAYKYNKEKATKFINEKIIKGKEGLLNIVLAELNR